MQAATVIIAPIGAENAHYIWSATASEPESQLNFRSSSRSLAHTIPWSISSRNVTCVSSTVHGVNAQDLSVPSSWRDRYTEVVFLCALTNTLVDLASTNGLGQFMVLPAWASPASAGVGDLLRRMLLIPAVGANGAYGSRTSHVYTPNVIWKMPDNVTVKAGAAGPGSALTQASLHTPVVIDTSQREVESRKRVLIVLVV
ncbi:hypothetical protein PAXINDRAFT_157383 [Paxillus involutus ATCC 200175]|uniref:Uncharacterized protein n=1 Tax=Paxillus involutus ATCC 200175 TaxID=664439 RepID=A0A0C9T664_PAXIN|nr:hypothetical protein PAXINDRAFT_157383 [Paxillus involutus ATCC 200175]